MMAYLLGSEIRAEAMEGANAPPQGNIRTRTRAIQLGI
jgi:hypothetical protein